MSEPLSVQGYLTASDTRLVHSQAREGEIYSIRHPQIFEMRPVVTIVGRWRKRRKVEWVETDRPAIELMQVVGPGQVMRGAMGTVARRWPWDGIIIELVGRPLYVTGHTEDGSPVWDLSAPENL